MDLNFKTFGEGEPIIILHGLFGMLDNWQTIGKKLAVDYQVFLLDLRNHGRSPHSSIWSYATMAEDVEQFMLSQWIHRAAVIGHSMGGKVALQLAINQPEMVERLISVDMGIKKMIGNHDVIFDALQGVDILNVRARKDVEQALLTKIPDLGTRLFLMKNLTRNKQKGYEWKMNLEVIYNNYNEILKAVDFSEPFDNPTLFIRGQKSNYISDTDWIDIKSNFSDAQLITIPEAGHWVHADQPDLLLRALRNWLEATA